MIGNMVTELLPWLIALAISNTFVSISSFQPGSLSGNGYNPFQFVAMIMSMIAAVKYFSELYSYIQLATIPRKVLTNLWHGCLIIGVLSMVWTVVSLTKFGERLLPAFRNNFNQYTVGFFASSIELWIALSCLVGAFGLWQKDRANH